MTDLEQVIADTKADLEYAEEVLRQRQNELETARGNMEKARLTVDRLSKQYLSLLQSQVKQAPSHG